jgi:hypothetical protein
MVSGTTTARDTEMNMKACSVLVRLVGFALFTTKTTHAFGVVQHIRSAVVASHTSPMLLSSTRGPLSTKTTSATATTTTTTPTQLYSIINENNEPTTAVVTATTTSSKVPFYLDPGTKGGAVVGSVLLFLIPMLVYNVAIRAFHVDEIQAGIVIGVGFTVVATLAWVSTYIFRVATKDMTYVRCFFFVCVCVRVPVYDGCACL